MIIELTLSIREDKSLFLRLNVLFSHQLIQGASNVNAYVPAGRWYDYYTVSVLLFALTRKYYDDLKLHEPWIKNYKFISNKKNEHLMIQCCVLITQFILRI